MNDQTMPVLDEMTEEQVDRAHRAVERIADRSRAKTAEHLLSMFRKALGK